MVILLLLSSSEVAESSEKLSSWSWIYGKSPKFSLEQDVLLRGEDNIQQDSQHEEDRVSVHIRQELRSV